MKQEEKELLLKDLCARLPYCVKGQYNNTVMSLHMIDPFDNYCPLYCVTESGSKYIGIDEFKPYLFPLSSMTEEQKEEYCSLQQKVIYNSKGLINSDVMEYINWCYKNHIDINNLIPMGIANDASGLNIY